MKRPDQNALAFPLSFLGGGISERTDSHSVLESGIDGLGFVVKKRVWLVLEVFFGTCGMFAGSGAAGEPPVASVSGIVPGTTAEVFADTGIWENPGCNLYCRRI